MLDERHVRFGDLDSRESVAGREDGVIERIGGVGSGLVEESGEVAFKACFVV